MSLIPWPADWEVRLAEQREKDVQQTIEFEETEKKWIEGKEYVVTTSSKYPLSFVKAADPPLEPGNPGWVNYKIHYSVSAPSGNLTVKKITYETKSGAV